MSFRYYLPAVGRETFLADHIKVLQEFGLGDVLRDTLQPGKALAYFMLGEVAAHGPDGHGGIVIVARSSPADVPSRVGHFPDRQVWLQPPGARYYVGVDNEERPTPESLQRADLISGVEIELADGNFWIAPTIRKFGINQNNPAKYGICQLPMTWGNDPQTGAFGEILKPDWQQYWDLSELIFDWFTVIDSTAILKQDAFEKAVECLSINYRLGTFEASLLQIIDNQNYQAIFSAAIDGQLLAQFLKSDEVSAGLREAIQRADGAAKKNGADSESPVCVNSTPGPADI